ncbi:N-acetyltransferase [Pontibacter flavimaris]|uniref:Acetyltransferase n=1 Tax=Pontibacter flavimaris TaxID=1797110 RepID=A0A1Q5PAG0_9BACT|nr:N-acetyltransferase [Pontibacter flavimaris]OKL39122.1 acetyltransferase [Pontibacter flavimaris]
MEIKPFNEINLNDPFFDSLKADYSEFEQWYVKKAKTGATAYVMHDENDQVQAFLYLKVEEGAITDVEPALPNQKWLKVGTFKVNPHGTRLGEKFIKKILDNAVVSQTPAIYVTVFPKHENLINLLSRYGFEKEGVKSTTNGNEDVMVKYMTVLQDNLLKDYPLITSKNSSKYVLGIKPEFHTKLFPDSKLLNEQYDLIQDVSHTNSIHKVYICFMEVGALKPGDLIAIYRTSDGLGPARFRSVITSICVVEEIKTRNDFASIDEYLNYCRSYSVFNDAELTQWYTKSGKLYVIKMTYNVALKKRITNGVLKDELGIDPGYWGFFKLTDQQLLGLLQKGEVNESIIIN